MPTNYYSYEGSAAVDNVDFKFMATFEDGREIENLHDLLVTTSTGQVVCNKRICKKIRLLIKRGKDNMTFKSGLRLNNDGTFKKLRR